MNENGCGCSISAENEFIAFVKTNLDREEALAKAAGGGNPDGSWERPDPDSSPGRIQTASGYVVVYDEGSPDDGQAAFIANFDPDSRLLDITAIRNILADLEEWKEKLKTAAGFEVFMASAFATIMCLLLLHIATRWADQPGYRKDWVPRPAEQWLSVEEIERIVGEDPDDRAIREAHGFTFEDDWQDKSLLCRNGCGIAYPDIAGGKIRECRASSIKSASPMVILDFDVHWCPRHLEPYRGQWPKGAALAMARLFNAAVVMPAVHDAAGGDANNIKAALDRFAPLCCFIGKEALDAIYAETVPS